MVELGLGQDVADLESECLLEAGHPTAACGIVAEEAAGMAIDRSLPPTVDS
jgi:hypothetical protein